MNYNSDMNLASNFKRKHRWLVEAKRSDGSIMIENMFCGVQSQDPTTAFGQIGIRLCLHKADLDRLRGNLTEISRLRVRLLDGCGTLKEDWEIKDVVVRSVHVEEWIPQNWTDDPTCPFGDFLSFSVTGSFNLVEMGG